MVSGQDNLSMVSGQDDGNYEAQAEEEHEEEEEEKDDHPHDREEGDEEEEEPEEDWGYNVVSHLSHAK